MFQNDINFFNDIISKMTEKTFKPSDSTITISVFFIASVFKFKFQTFLAEGGVKFSGFFGYTGYLVNPRTNIEWMLNTVEQTSFV